MVNPDTAIDKCFRLTDKQKSALRKLQIHTANDLLFHFPSRYEDFSQIKLIADSEVGEKVVVVGILRKLEASRTWTTKIPVAKARVYDESGVLDVVWFRQPYMATMLHDETPVKLTGTITQTNKRRTMTNPVVEKIANISLKHDEQATPNIILPVYPESQGITSRWFYYAVNKLMNGGILEYVEDALPQDILLKYHLPGINTALRVIHSPRSGAESEAARKRFAFEEVLYIQLAKQKERDSMRKQKSFTINKHINDLEPLMSQYPFAPTNAQTKAILAILDDFGRPSAMSRLLEGDVGSGKTLVAAATAFAVAGEQFEGTSAPLQVAYMAPTEILARQHFETFLTYFKGLSIPIGLITGSVCMKFPSKVNPGSATQLSRAQFLRFVERGEIPIVIGTHSLIQKSLHFKHLAYVIIDEQHRFGVRQRQALSRGNNDAPIPHLLSMTATPIPRTLALTIYGDLDLTLLDEMPPGRKPIITKITAPKDRSAAYSHIVKELKAGRQAYVICPRIDEPDPDKALALQAKSVVEEKRHLEMGVFKDYNVDILHGKMKPSERDSIMEQFEQGNINVLVATSVVEVGVNVPNATVIVIEGAERFGLSQLHQLRGRVLRSTHQAYCYLFTDSRADKTKDRLKALEKAKNGFELAEHDLKLRGPGELIGGRQWGISDIGMEALRNIKMVEAARVEAYRLVNNLSQYPLLKLRSERGGAIHLE